MVTTIAGGPGAMQQQQQQILVQKQQSPQHQTPPPQGQPQRVIPQGSLQQGIQWRPPVVIFFYLTSEIFGNGVLYEASHYLVFSFKI